MRTISQNLIDAVDADRKINARMTIRDILPRFDEKTPTQDKSDIENYRHHDSSIYNGILRVACESSSFSNQALWHNYISTPGTFPWPTWVSSSIDMKQRSSPGLFEQYIWYQASAGNIERRAFNSGTNSFGSATAMLTGTSGSSYSCRPINANEAYLMYYEINDETETDTTTLRIAYRNYSTSTTHTWPGCIYLNMGPPQCGPYMQWVWAIRDTDETGVSQDYIFFRNDGEGNTFFIKHKNGEWSDPQPVVAIDIVDDLSTFVIGGVTTINNDIVVTGILKRLDGPGMHVYLLGHPPFTMGRLFYISNHVVEDDDQGWDMIALGGKMHEYSDKLYFVAPGVNAEATNTYAFGNDTASLKTILTDISNISIATGHNSPSGLSFDILNSEDHAAILPGSEVIAELGYDDYYANMGTYSIIPVIRGQDSESKTKSIAARGSAMQEMSAWIADGDYIIQSQAKSSDDPGSIAHLIRVQGDVSEYADAGHTGLMPDKFNEDVYTYSVARSSRNWVGRGKFWYPDTAKNFPEFGILMNYYHGLEGDATNYAIAVTWERSSTPANGFIKISHVYDDVWTELTSVALNNLTTDAYHWIQAEWHDGHVRVLHRPDAISTWSEKLNYTYNKPPNSPWKRGKLGRCGFFMRNNSTEMNHPAIDETTIVIPVETHHNINVGDKMQIDDEIMEIKGQSPLGTPIPGGFAYATGYHIQDADWDNPYKGPFSGYEIWLVPYITEATDHDAYDRYALYISEGPGRHHAYEITDIDYSAPRQWYIDQEVDLPDTWINHIGDPAYGHWDDERPDHCRIFVRNKPNLIGEGSLLQMYHRLYVERGVDDTKAVQHDEGVISLIAENKIHINEFYAYSTDVDLSVEDVTKDIAHKCGVRTVNSEKLKDETISFTNSDWNLDADFNSNYEERKNFIMNMRFFTTTPPRTGIASRDSSGVYKTALIFLEGQIRIYSIAGDKSLTQIEAMPHDLTKNWLKISSHDGHISVWDNDKLVFSSHLWVESDQVGFISTGTVNIDVDWSMLDSRVDDFYYEVGSHGLSALQQLFTERRIYFQDDINGALRIFRTRELVNEGDPYTLAIAASNVDNIGQLKTRIRAEGFLAHEEIDFDLMRQYGNLFGVAEIMELTTEEEFEAEAIAILEDIVMLSKERTFLGGADPRIEPDDKIEVTLPDGTKTVVVSGVTFTIDSDFSDAYFDMEVITIGDL